MTVDKCRDCGRPEDATINIVLLVQSDTVHGKVHWFATCQRCTLKRGAQDALERRELEQRAEKAVR